MTNETSSYRNRAALARIKEKEKEITMPKKTRSEDDNAMEEYDDDQSMDLDDQGEELDFGGEEELLLDDSEEDDELAPSVLYKGVSRPKTEDDWRQLLIEANKDSVPTYQLSDSYREGDLVTHSQFGFGVISKVISPRKIEVVFESGKKLLAMNVSLPE